MPEINDFKAIVEEAAKATRLMTTMVAEARNIGLGDTDMVKTLEFAATTMGLVLGGMEGTKAGKLAASGDREAINAELTRIAAELETAAVAAAAAGKDFLL